MPSPHPNQKIQHTKSKSRESSRRATNTYRQASAFVQRHSPSSSIINSAQRTSQYSFGYEPRAAPYIALTAQALEEHDASIQRSSHEVESHCLQVIQNRRVEEWFSRLGTHLGYAAPMTLYKDLLEMESAGSFKASSVQPLQLPGHGEMSFPHNGFSRAQRTLHDHEDDTSSMVAQSHSEEQTHPQGSARDFVVFVPEQRYQASSFRYARDIAVETELMGIGTQFDIL